LVETKEVPMATTLTQMDGGKVLEVQTRGKMTHEDYLHFASQFEEMFKLHGKLNVLFEMIDFHGWDAAAMWDELKFDLKHFSHIHRLALVGDKKWEKGMGVFCRPFTAAQIRYFDITELNQARAWVQGA
jgi:hypothetical protein